ncbi:hypothetical protein Sjap_016882 [Stephania japonica]|uniref:Uncharacterized protein n=1 Tax=Stephania japonica TaxID=461633 RepID=A0AAP0I547_9MAGN
MMKSLLVYFTLILFISAVNARKAPLDYWKDAMKDQTIPEGLKDLLATKPNFSYKQKADCHESLQAQDSNQDSNEAPNVTIYHGDAEKNEEKQFMKKGTQNSNQDLDESPTVTIYHGDQYLDDKPNATIYHRDQDLDETPNVTIYHGDQDVDETPNIIIYHGDANTDGEKKFMKDENKDEQSQPSVTIYHG